MMIDLAEAFDKPKYIASIRQAHNGFAVEVEQEITRKGPMSPKQAQRKISGFMNSLQDQMESGPVDTKLREIYAKEGISPSGQADDDDEETGPPIIGLHIFKTFQELTAFLSFVYDKNEEAKK